MIADIPPVAMLRSFIVIPVVVLAVACASTDARTPDDYDPGKTPRAQFLKEASLCEKQAEADQKQLGFGPYDPSHGTYNRMFDACMRASGYLRK
jgi:hypothetical protein